MQQKYIELLDRLEAFFNEIDIPVEEDEEFDAVYSITSKNGMAIEELQKDVATLNKNSHPPVFKTSDYKDLLKRISTIEKKCKCK